MADRFAVLVEGLDSLQDIEHLPENISRWARQALNRTLDRTRTETARRVLQVANLPASYVSPSQGRLTVKKRPSVGNLEGSIFAQGRATSLARFAVNRSAKPGEVVVQVKPGGARRMRKAWLIKLRSGGNTDNNGNLGLAVRLKPGETIQNKRLTARQLFPNVYLLYGPSVAQIVGNTAEDQIGPDALDFLEAEFDRLSKL